MAEIPNLKRIQDRDEYVRNRAKFGPDELRPYEGQWVAWSLDGSRIVAHHEDPAEVLRMVQEAGLTSEDVVFAPIPVGGVVETIL